MELVWIDPQFIHFQMKKEANRIWCLTGVYVKLVELSKIQLKAMPQD